MHPELHPLLLIFIGSFIWHLSGFLKHPLLSGSGGYACRNEPITKGVCSQSRGVKAYFGVLLLH